MLVRHFCTLLGISQLGVSPDIRVPISLELVDKLCGSLTYTCTHKFDITLYSSMYLMAFFGFLRVGEIAVSNGNYDNLLTINSVQFNHTGKGVLVSFVKYISIQRVEYTLYR